MTFVLDASTLINLANGGVLSIVLALPSTSFVVSGTVRKESRTIASAVNAAVAEGRLTLTDDRLISAEEFAAAKARLNLDEGETECILVAARLGYSVACDDGAARARAAHELGDDRVTGSIGLLKRACDVELLSPAEARSAYDLMVSRGGFLPIIDDRFFDVPRDS